VIAEELNKYYKYLFDTKASKNPKECLTYLKKRKSILLKLTD